jgi:hypothetical protein
MGSLSPRGTACTMGAPMSEFSESSHLEADDQQAGVDLLGRDSPRWLRVSIAARLGDDRPPIELRRGTARLDRGHEGCLLRSLPYQDPGWMFEVDSGPTPPPTTSAVGWTGATRRTGSRSRRTTWTSRGVWAIAQRHGHGPQLVNLQRIPRPRIVRWTGRQTAKHYGDFVDWPASETLDNLAYAFARLVGLPRYQWLRWRDDLSDEREWLQQGAVRVKRP